jgi:hypothetical protein
MAIGRDGEGPGEISTYGSPFLHMGSGDSLYVVDSRRISVFDTAGKFQRAINAPQISSRGEARFVSDGGHIISSGDARGVDSDRWFHVSGPDGKVIRSFGPLSDGAQPAGTDRNRVIAYDGGPTFWTAYAPAGDGSYRIEEWSIDGQRTRVFRRDADWFKPQADDDPFPTKFPPFQVMHVSEGLVWLVAVVRDARWREIPVRDEALSRVSELFDLRYDVIDTNAGSVLVSGVIDEIPTGTADRPFPPIVRFIPRTSRSYRPVTDSLGLETIQVFDIVLVRSN